MGVVRSLISDGHCFQLEMICIINFEKLENTNNRSPLLKWPGTAGKDADRRPRADGRTFCAHVCMCV